MRKLVFLSVLLSIAGYACSREAEKSGKLDGQVSNEPVVPEDTCGKESPALWVYEAAENGTAELILTLREGGCFDFHFRDFQFDEEAFLWTGKYKQVGEQWELLFDDDQLQLDGLFNERYDSNNAYNMEGEKVYINYKVPKMFVYGVLCKLKN